MNSKETITTKTNKNNLISWITVYLGTSEIGDIHLPPTLTNEELKKAEDCTLQLCLTVLRIGKIRGVAEVRDGVKTALGL